MTAAAGLDRRALLATTGAALVAAAIPARLRAAGSWGEDDYARAAIIDAQGAIGGDAVTPEVAAAIRSSGMTALSMTVGRTGSGAGLFDDSVAEIARVTQMCEDHPDLLMIVRTAADIAEAKRSKRVGIIMNFQDTSPLEADLANVALFKGLGLRTLQLTYNQRNLAGDGSIEAADAGLSDFGRRLIAEIEAQKLLLDLSHGGRRTIAEAIAAATRPPTISHTGCRALADLSRNVDDASLKALADKGGVAGIYLMPFLSTAGAPTGKDVLRHIEHAIGICGEDHVGIGTDNSLVASPINPEAYAEQRKFYERRKARGVAAPGEAPDVLNLVADYNDPRRFFMIGRDLARRGHPARRIDKILGGNFARLYAEVWG